MKKSIRYKIFLLFASLIFVIILLGMLFNKLYMEKFYVAQNETLLAGIAAEVESLYYQHQTSFEDTLSDIGRTESVGIFITNNQFEILFSSNKQEQNSEERKIPLEIEKKIESGMTSSFFGTTERENAESPNIVYAKIMSDASILVITKSLRGIRSSVAIANQFYMIVGLISLIIGVLAVMLFSKVVTDPIIRIKDVTSAISQMKFDQQVNVRGQDELSDLAISINHMSRQLQQNIENLKKDITRHKQLVRDLSHELKTPITIIKGYVEGLSHGLADNPRKQEQYLETIVNECIRMDSLVHDMLILSKLEAGKYELKTEDFQAEEFLQQIIARFTAQIQEKGAVCTFTCDPAVHLYADKKQIDTAISNYLMNAVNHVNAAGTIHVDCQYKESSVDIVVMNTGSRIPADQMEKIWDVFYLRDQSRNRATCGHGVGLAIVKSIAENHQAQVYAINGEDSVQFIFSLPL